MAKKQSTEVVPIKRPWNPRQQLEELAQESLEMLKDWRDDPATPLNQRISIAQDFMDRAPATQRGHASEVSHEHKHSFTAENLISAAKTAQETSKAIPIKPEKVE
jgi:hypothetical protein